MAKIISMFAVYFWILANASMDAVLSAEPVRVEVSRDAWISAYPTEQGGNNGGAFRLKLKGIQEFFLIDFDPLPLQGKTVQRAELVLRGEGNESLDRVTVSTLMSEWVEGDGSEYAVNNEGASFLFRSGKQRWHSEDLGDVTSVSLGNGGSQWCFGDASPRDEDNWQRIPIDPAIVQSRINGKCHGFLVMDDLGSEYTRTGERFEYHLMPNRMLASREKNRSQAPYFRVWLSDEAAMPSENNSSKTTSNKLLDNSVVDSLQKLLVPMIIDDKRVESSDTFLNLDFKPADNRDRCLAHGETISLIIPTSPDRVKLDSNGVFQVELFALPQIGGQFDPAVPFELWMQDDWKLGKNSEQVFTCIDIYADKKTSKGKSSVSLQINGENKQLELTVLDFELPDRLNFIPQMNCYGLPDDEVAYFQLCHEHRTTLNRLRYGWTGKANSEAVPKIRKDGTWDWTAWDLHFGPLLDGSAFANSRRGAIPIEAFYLPLNENWPMDHEQHFRGDYWIEDAYDAEYWTEFRNAVQRFSEHLAEKNYDQTLFEFYLNNKVYFKEQRGGRWSGSSAAWVFDEPVNTQDFWALRRFGIEFWKATEATKRPQLGFRIDISRPQWQRDILDGVSNVEVVSGALRDYNERVIERARRYGNRVYMYGSANEIGTPNSTNAAWCVETWLRGGDGVVPWQTIGSESSWQTQDPLSVIYPSDFGPIASLRLKSFRDGQQLVEYLVRYQSQFQGVNAEQVGKVLLTALELNGKTQKSSEADAGSVVFNGKTQQRLRDFRYRLGNQLQQPSTANNNDKRLQIPRQGLSDDMKLIEPIQLK